MKPLMLILLISLLASGGVEVGMSPWSATASRSPKLVTVVLQSEVLEPVQGAEVRLTGSSTRPAHASAPTGVAGPFRDVVEDEFGISIMPTTVPGGQTVGLQYRIDVRDDEWPGRAILPRLVLNCVVPVAWHVSLPVKESAYARPWHDAWLVEPTPDWEPALDRIRVAYIGSRQVHAAVMKFAAGRDLSADVGLAIFSEGRIELPKGGVVVRVRSPGLPQGEPTGVAVCQVSASVGSLTLHAKLGAQADGYAALTLRGAVLPGLNLVSLGTLSPDFPDVTIREVRHPRLESPAVLEQQPAAASVSGWAFPAPALPGTSAGQYRLEGTEFSVEQTLWSAGEGPVFLSEKEIEWTMRVLWLGTPAVLVDPSSWISWSHGNELAMDTNSGVVPQGSIRESVGKRLWLYRRVAWRSSSWVRTIDGAERHIRCVCIWPSAVCDGVLGP